VERAISSTTSGTIEPHASSVLKAETQGAVVEVCFDEGDRVERNAVIVRLDDRDAQANLKLSISDEEVARTNLSQAEVRMENARKDFERAKTLRGKEILSQQQYDKFWMEFQLAEKEVESARARLNEIKSQFELVKLNLDKKEIKAPFNGLITDVLVDTGELAVLGTPVCEILDVSELKVTAPVDETELSLLKLGQNVRVTLDAYPDEKHSGAVVEIAPVVSTNLEQDRTIKVTVSLNPLLDIYKVGMSADIEIIVEQANGVLYLPSNAVMEEKGKKFVLVVERGRAVKKNLTPGTSNWDRTEVKDGLKDNDLIILSLEAPGLKEGCRVKVKPQ
jgi:HlyD family secretion protein